MPLANLLNIPASFNDWNSWSLAHKLDHDQIRLAILTDTSTTIKAVAVTNAGSGYTPGSYYLVFTGGNGTGLAGYYTVGSNGTVVSTTITTEGTGYSIFPAVTFPYGLGSGAAGVAQSSTINLFQYQLDPINFDDPQQWLENNAQTHDDMNGVLGLQGTDLQGVDLKDKNQLNAWIFLHYQEHYSAHQALGI